ncbi:hypothetical protein N2152v2_010792 [Parachlorella kessleri]
MNPSQVQSDVEDLEDANLLQQLPATVGFIQQALHNDGRVLVHCAAGVSRSVAVVMAYLMASQPKLTALQALELVREAHPPACPNPGFMQQLELFRAMGCRLDESFLPYKRFLLGRVGKAYEETGLLDAASLAQPTDAGDNDATLYRCRKCRTLVATSHNVVEVEQGPGAGAFPWRKRDKQQRQLTAGSSTPGEQEQQQYLEPWEQMDGGGAVLGSGSSGGSGDGGSLFTEPLRWMAGMVVGGPVQGKLYCPKCSARLGSFNWSGTQSSSGGWVVPSFQLHMTRLDAIDPRPPVVLATVRQPRILTASPAAAGLGQQQEVGGSSPRKQLEFSVTDLGQAGTDNSRGERCGSGYSPSGEPVALAQQLQQQAALTAPDQAAADRGACAAATAPGLLAAGAARTTTTNGVAAGGGGTEAAAASSLRFTHLILDCDGVLVDSERASCEALRQSILQVTGFDIPHSFPQDYQPVFGMDVETCVRYYKDRFQLHSWGDPVVLAAEVSAVKEGMYKRLTDGGVPAFQGAAELIRLAYRLGLGVAIASSGSPEKIRHNLSSSGLWGLVQEHLVVSAKYVAMGKPAPDVYLEALKRLGCMDASRALVVEDAVNGLKAARGAGCFSVGITNSLPRHMLESYADAVVNEISECSQLLQTSLQ